MSPDGRYHYRKGYNPKAIAATAAGAVVAVAPVLVPVLAPAAQYTWFIGMLVGLAVYTVASKR
jgi:NCS1 family nucleobase:cation symporter-1